MLGELEEMPRNSVGSGVGAWVGKLDGAGLGIQVGDSVATFSSTVNNNKYSSMTAATDTFQGNNTEDHWSTYNHQSQQTSSNFSNLSATEHRHLAKEINEMESQHWTHKKEVNEMKTNKYFNDTKSSEMKKERNKNATLIETYERYDIGGAGELDLGGQSPRVDPPPALTARFTVPPCMVHLPFC